MKIWPVTLAAMLVLPAFAQAQNMPAAATDAPTQASAPAQPAAPPKGETPQASQDDRRCLRETGSRITASHNARERRTTRDPAARKLECAQAFGRSYSREDIERTGASNLRDALRMLDPAVH